MRAGRLVSLLLLLQTRGRMTARRLAEELEVSVRTVYRDVEALGAAGVPIYAERGPDGGYRLLEGYRTRLTGLTSPEAESLFLTGMPGAAADLGLAAELAAAELKLLAALPAELRGRATRTRERFHLDAPGWYREPDETPHLAAVAEAVWGGRRIAVDYRRWSADASVRRVLDPLGLVLKGGLWYLVARAAAAHGTHGTHGTHGAADGGGDPHGAADGGAHPGGDGPSAAADPDSGRRSAVRTYRIRQIRDLRTLPETFERPAGFDLAAFWADSAERFEQELYRHEALVRIAPQALRQLLATSPPVVRRAAQEAAGPPDGDGWVRTVLRYEMPEQARTALLALGPGVEVLGPAELRGTMAAQARALAALYGPRV